MNSLSGGELSEMVSSETKLRDDRTRDACLANGAAPRTLSPGRTRATARSRRSIQLPVDTFEAPGPRSMGQAQKRLF
jgi:hypothetical protein